MGSHSIRMLRLTMLLHSVRLVRDVVAPLVGAEHTSTIVHADVHTHGVRVVHEIPTVRTEYLLEGHAMRKDLGTTQRCHGMKRRQSHHLCPESLVVGWERVAVFIQKTCQDVVKLEALHVGIRRRLEGLIATDIGQCLLEIRVEELQIFVAL